jgi:Flp pilus assembly protein TadD
MKLWLFGLGVCLFSTPELAAQSATPISNSWATFEAQRLIALAQEFSLDHVNQPTPSLRRSQDDAVVSLQRLTHKGDQRARKLSEKGLHEYRRHRYGEALSFLQKALETDPHSSVLQNNLGVVYCLLGQDEAAQQAFQQAIALDSSAAMSYVNLAKVAFNTYQYHLAEASARQALRVAPLSPEARLVLGLAEVAQDHWTPEARQFLEENRSRFSQAELVLQHWPRADELLAGTPKAVFVRGAGPAAFAKAPLRSVKANPASQ